MVEVESVESLLDFGEFGAVLEGRNMNTKLWIDYYGVCSARRYVITSGGGSLLFESDDLAEALKQWKEYET